MQTRTINQLIAEYKHSEEFTKLKPRTQDTYVDNIKHLLKIFDCIDITSIDTKAIKEYRNYREIKSVSQTNKEIRVLSILFNYAISEGYIDTNPTITVKKTYLAPDLTCWTKQEFTTMCTHIRNNTPFTYLETILYIGYYTGLRTNDILNVQWENIVNNMLTIIQEKTSKAVSIPLHTQLQQYLSGIQKDNAYVVRTVKNRKVAVNESYIQRIFRREAKKAGLNHLQIKHLRNTAITILADAGCTIAEICAISGHSLKHAHTILNQYLSHTQTQAHNAMSKWETYDKQQHN